MIKGFALAEVLFTLGIIGIVAALTIPSMITNHQKKQTAIKLKQTYSLMQQAIKMAENDTGIESKDWEYNDSKSFCDTYLKNYLNVIKEYNAQESADIDIYCNNGEICSTYGQFKKAQKLILSNGVLLAPGPMTSTTTDGKQYNATTIIVDINGLKRPNKFGRDVFMFNIDYTKGIIPYGIVAVYNLEEGTKDISLSRDELMNGDNERSCKQKGLFCAAIIMMDNWEIEADYPWE